MDVPRELVEQFARGNGVIFVGAGLSQGAGVPGWSELLTPLAASIGVPPGTDPLKIAQFTKSTAGGRRIRFDGVTGHCMSTNREKSPCPSLITSTN